MKILVIDDDIICRRMIVKTIEGAGHSAIQSGNGKHGWETLWENPDVGMVISDIVMPDMDGKELLQIIRGNQAFADIPIVLISGVISLDELEPMMQKGPCLFCAKPLNVKQLRECMAKLGVPAS